MVNVCARSRTSSLTSRAFRALHPCLIHEPVQRQLDQVLESWGRGSASSKAAGCGNLRLKQSNNGNILPTSTPIQGDGEGENMSVLKSLKLSDAKPTAQAKTPVERGREKL